jgi:hypothetical protein
MAMALFPLSSLGGTAKKLRLTDLNLCHHHSYTLGRIKNEIPCEGVKQQKKFFHFTSVHPVEGTPHPPSFSISNTPLVFTLGNFIVRHT